ncbi:MAG: hypothetical protein V4592_22160 [Bacteroidota bacterium]
MKKVFVLAFIALLSTAAMAQKTIPAIKVGSTLSLDMDYHGQSLLLAVTVKGMGDVISIGWEVNGTGGTFAMKAKALESGTKFGGDQPAPDAVTPLADDATFMCISKAAYQSMVKNKTFIYSGLTYAVKDSPDGYKLDGKPVDATFAATADGKTSLWILNSPDFPITLAMKGNPAGIDYTASSVK